MSLPTFTFLTTAEEVADVFADQIRGKNVLITGTSINGIGLEAARVLAKYANLVIITGYNSERLKLSEEAVKKEVPGANIRQLVLDLSSLTAVRKAAVEVNAYPEPLHVLINNAAAAVGEFKLTEDGLETQMATDHISPFLLTKLLAPKLLSAGSASYIPRVVNVSSDTQALGSGVNLNTVAHPDPEKYSMFDAYCQAKSANVLFAIELSKRSEGKINAYSLHPGTIFTNIMKKKETEATLIAGGVLTSDGRPNTDQMQWKTLAQGAATTVAAAFDPRLESKPGAFLWDSVEANDKIAPHNSDPETAVKLWIITEGIIGEPFTF
ncbi:Short-chain dehydrogenase/reductase family protein [Mycena venus]|uniref:Short-chain dehydrogenase/reductase family protein n=1 Tax=Mycena venus TaxID=2733690 RepID=A0A8H6XPW1_9AGAR|nr:Short-chain dehydrogenase/reductase family protein [Mycena venus]